MLKGDSTLIKEYYNISPSKPLPSADLQSPRNRTIMSSIPRLGDERSKNYKQDAPTSELRPEEEKKNETENVAPPPTFYQPSDSNLTAATGGWKSQGVTPKNVIVNREVHEEYHSKNLELDQFFKAKE